MYLLDQLGTKIWAVDAPNWIKAGDKDHLKVGVSKKIIEERAKHGFRWSLGQLYGVVGPGLIFTQHVFQGLKRSMLVEGDMNADGTKFALSWEAKHDAKLIGDSQNCELDYCDSPPQAVFVVYISPNKMLEQFPDIHGWIEHWTWVAGNPALPGAPIDSETRYDKLLWSSP